MKSLFAKILLWFWVTLAITVVGSAFISALNVNENASDERAPVARLVRFQLEEARSAYEIGGRPGLQAFLDTLNRVYDARGILTDETGRDLLTNQDRLRPDAAGAAPLFLPDFSHGRRHGVARRPMMAATGSSSSCRECGWDPGFCCRSTSS